MERSRLNDSYSSYLGIDGGLIADEKRALRRLENRVQGALEHRDPGSVLPSDQVSLEVVLSAVKLLDSALSAEQRLLLSMRSFRYTPPKVHGDRLILDVSHNSEHVYALFRHLEYESEICRLAQADVKSNFFLRLVPSARANQSARADEHVKQITGLLTLRSLFRETAIVFDKALRCRWPQILEHRRTIIALEGRDEGYSRVYAQESPSAEDVIAARIAAIDHRSRIVAQSLRGHIPKTQRCPYCEGPMLPGHEHLDHISPVSRGGLSVTENLVYVCETCNVVKSDRSLFDFLASIGADSKTIYARLHWMGKRV